MLKVLVGEKSLVVKNFGSEKHCSEKFGSKIHHTHYDTLFPQTYQIHFDLQNVANPTQFGYISKSEHNNCFFPSRMNIRIYMGEDMFAK